MVGGASNLELQGPLAGIQTFAMRASNGTSAFTDHEIISQVLRRDFAFDQSPLSVSLPALMTGPEEVGALIEFDHPRREDLIHSKNLKSSTGLTGTFGSPVKVPVCSVAVSTEGGGPHS